MLNLQSVLSWEIAGLAAIVVIVVRVLRATNLLKTGDWARGASTVISALLSGFSLSDPESVAITSAVLMLATSVHELIAWIEVKYVEYKKNKEELGDK